MQNWLSLVAIILCFKTLLAETTSVLLEEKWKIDDFAHEESERQKSNLFLCFSLFSSVRAERGRKRSNFVRTLFLSLSPRNDATMHLAELVIKRSKRVGTVVPRWESFWNSELSLLLSLGGFFTPRLALTAFNDTANHCVNTTPTSSLPECVLVLKVLILIATHKYIIDRHVCQGSHLERHSNYSTLFCSWGRERANTLTTVPFLHAHLVTHFQYSLSGASLTCSGCISLSNCHPLLSPWT